METAVWIITFFPLLDYYFLFMSFQFLDFGLIDSSLGIPESGKSISSFHKGIYLH